MSEPNEHDVSLLVKALAVDRSTALILVENGITSVEEVAYVPFDELQETGIAKAVLQLLRERAKECLLR